MDKQRRVDQARAFIRHAAYPHGTHPALVPGVSVEDQRIRYHVDRPILVVVGALIVAFVAWGIARPQQVFSMSSAALNWVMLNLGWVFSIVAVGLVIVLLGIALSRYGDIPLGLDGEKPEFSTVSWSAMLFAAGIGIGLIFFGPFEPLSFYLEPRPGAYEPATQEAVKGALTQAAVHWGLNAWAIYGIVGLAVGYISFRRGKVPLMSSIFEFGSSSAPGARIIDGLAIIATLFGTAASLGIGALQISRGVELVTGWSPKGNALAIGIIAILTAGTIASAVSGVARGIRWLSNINMVLSVGLALFFFLVGPTAVLANMIPGVIANYVGDLPQILSANMGEGEEMQEFLSSWTTFYWAWWISWSPFVGVFVAKISRGRTIRQFVFGVLFIPSTIIVLAFCILGGTAIVLQRETGALAANNDIAQLASPEDIFFEVLGMLPGAQFMVPLVIAMLAVFFITTADSASLVNSQLSQQGNPRPKKLVTTFWALCMAGIAVVILISGGEDALQGLQNFITVTALPFAVIIIGMTVALLRQLRNDPLTIRARFQREALENAIVEGVKEYGDGFALVVEKADEERAAGAEFDSTAEEYTSWYERTDYDGTPIGYDYETGEYLEPNSTAGTTNTPREKPDTD